MWWTCTFPHSALICNAVLCLILSNVRRARRRTGEQIHSYRISTLTATGAQVVQTKTQTHYFKWINLTFHSEPIFDDIRERDVCIVSDSVSILTRFLFLPKLLKGCWHFMFGLGSIGNGILHILFRICQIGISAEIEQTFLGIFPVEYLEYGCQFVEQCSMNIYISALQCIVIIPKIYLL